MSLSQDEQRKLAEIERRLAAEDPRLAARMSSFRRTGPSRVLHSGRMRIICSMLTVTVVGVISLVVYALLPFRSQSPRTVSGHPTTSLGQPLITVPDSHPPASKAGKTTATATTGTARRTRPGTGATGGRSGSATRKPASGTGSGSAATHGP